MDLPIPDYLFGFNAAAQAAVLASILFLIWLGAARMPTRRSERVTTASILSVGLLGWFASPTTLAGRTSTGLPTIPPSQPSSSAFWFRS